MLCFSDKLLVTLRYNFYINRIMIKNLILDFGKVLVDYDFETFFRKNIPNPQRCEAVTTILCDPETLNTFDRESKPLDKIVDDLIALHPEYEAEIHMFVEHYPEIIIGEMPGMYELLTSLKEQGLKLYGLTNWCSKVHLTMQQYPIFSLLDGRVISSEEHLIKPEPAIYQCLLDRYNLNPEECLFADDKPVNIQGALAMGMHGIVFRNSAQFRQELQQYLSRHV